RAECSASLSARTRADGAAWPGIYNAVPARSFNEEASGPFVGPGIVPALAHTKVPGHVGIVADGGFDLGARVDAHGFPATLALGRLGAEARELRARARPQPVADVGRQRAALAGEVDRGDTSARHAAANVDSRLRPVAAHAAVDVGGEAQRRGHLAILAGAVDRTQPRRHLQPARAQRADHDLLDARGAVAREPEHRHLAADAGTVGFPLRLRS